MDRYPFETIPYRCKFMQMAALQITPLISVYYSDVEATKAFENRLCKMQTIFYYILLFVEFLVSTDFWNFCFIIV